MAPTSTPSAIADYLSLSNALTLVGVLARN
jgi:hypothetical protein